MLSTLVQRPLFAIRTFPAHTAKALLLMALVGVAYHYSLGTLARGLGLQTPLAYLALVPVTAALLAWYALSVDPDRGDHTLPLDFVLSRVAGVLLLLAGVVLALLVPVSVDFWLSRVDMLSLPLFVAGMITLFYGVRRLWVLRFPIGFLLLAWPAVYSPLLADATDLLTQLTITVMRAISVVVPIAQSSGDGDLFMVHNISGSFPIVVASACAGVNSLVGYVLVGTALGYVVRGPMARRLAWIAVGIGLIWVLNLARIEAIFLVGAVFGRQAALDVLHPIAGLLVFNAGVLLMLAFSTRFGLYFERGPERIPHPGPVVRHRRLHAMFIGLTVALALVLGVVNHGYARYEPLTNGLGTARLAAFQSSRAAEIGWESSFVATFDGGRQFFGETSTWTRYQYLSGQSSELQASAPLYLDLIEVDDPNTLAAYGLEECYRFHGYLVEDQRRVELAPGITGEVISYQNPKLGADWSALWWQWPYQDGSRVRYQRVVLFVFDGPRATFDGIAPVASSTQRFATTHAFLEAAGRQLIATHLAVEQVNAT